MSPPGAPTRRAPGTSKRAKGRPPSARTLERTLGVSWEMSGAWRCMPDGSWRVPTPATSWRVPAGAGTVLARASAPSPAYARSPTSQSAWSRGRPTADGSPPWDPPSPTPGSAETEALPDPPEACDRRAGSFMSSREGGGGDTEVPVETEPTGAAPSTTPHGTPPAAAAPPPHHRTVTAPTRSPPWRPRFPRPHPRRPDD